MNAAYTLLLHALGVAHGIGASLVCAACFYIGGLVFVPRRFDESLGPGESPAVLGAALYVLLCWFGIASGIPLTRLAFGFASVVLFLAVVRYRSVAIALKTRGVLSVGTLGWLLTFSLLYVLAYLFTMPPVTGNDLPLAWSGNVDLLHYVIFTRYLLRLGPSNLAGYSFLNDIYLMTPAVFYFLGWLSVLFSQDPLRAAMPAQFALTALIGVFAARISRSVFTVSRVSALAIACIVVSGPFFRYVVANYFLSTLMSTPILLYLLWTTVQHRSLRFLDAGLAVRFGSAYVLLLFMYPPLLVVGLGAQAAAIVLTQIAELQSGDVSRPPWLEAGRDLGRMVCAVLVALGLSALCFRERLAWSTNVVISLTQKGIGGWPLDVISPLAMLGLPGTTSHVQVENQAHRVWALAAFCVIALALGFLYFWRFRRRTTAAERTFAGLAGGSFILYCAYFLHLGPSYQQWKFASYSALPLSFVVFASCLRLSQRSAVYARVARTVSGRRRVTALLTLVGASVVGGNLLVHAMSDPVLIQLPGELHNLTKVDKLPYFRDLTVWMNDQFPGLDTYLALYFIQTKRLHVVSSRFSPNEPLSFEQISREWPLLIQNYGCEGVGHDDTITMPDVGCLLMAPPSLALDTVYPFNQTFLFVDVVGMSQRGAGGRLNLESTVLLKLTADPRRSRVGQNSYVNLRLNPYLPPEIMQRLPMLNLKDLDQLLKKYTTARRLAFNWGANQQGEATLDDRQWISLPVRTADWRGEWVRTLPISIQLPDDLAVAFEELSVSVSPSGHTIVPFTAARSPSE